MDRGREGRREEGWRREGGREGGREGARRGRIEEGGGGMRDEGAGCVCVCGGDLLHVCVCVWRRLTPCGRVCVEETCSMRACVCGGDLLHVGVCVCGGDLLHVYVCVCEFLRPPSSVYHWGPDVTFHRD